MRTLAIGDIHGCLRAFELLLDAVALTSEDKIVTLGDYVARGSDSKGVIDRLINLHQKSQLIAIRGNHDQMMLDAYLNPQPDESWFKLFGEGILDSYGILGKQATFADIPESHWHFLANICLKWWETETHFFVHGNVDSQLPLNQQSDDNLLWQKFSDTQPPHYSGKTMICGHTRQKSGQPVNLGYAICIDTWAYGEGWLTGLDVHSGQIWQTNQQGQLKTAHISNFFRGKTYNQNFLNQRINQMQLLVG